VRVTVLGDVAGNTRLERAGAEVRSNARPEPGDLVLIAVSARHGPVPALLDALDLADGYEAGRLAVLVTDVEHGSDHELVALVAWEAKYLLQGTGVVRYPQAEALSVLRSDDSNLAQSLELVSLVEPPIRLSKPDRSPDW
jgi:translation elongation factor EF-Tu-like GTPase